MNHHSMEGMDHAMHGMTEMAAASGFDYTLAFAAGFGQRPLPGNVRGAGIRLFHESRKKQKLFALSGLPNGADFGLRHDRHVGGGVGRGAGIERLVRQNQSVLQITMGLVVIALAMGVLGWIPWQGSLRLIPLAVLRKGYATANQRGPLIGSVIAGFLNGLMPCMLTFAMAVKATTATSVLEGGALMLAFGAGTLPMMLFISVAFGKMSAKLRGYMFKAAALIMLAMGLNTINNGLSFYLDQDFDHSHFLFFLQAQLDRLILFLAQIMDYLSGMIDSIRNK